MKLSDKAIVIIGAGPAGYSAALELRKKFSTQKIILIEKNKLGGTCLHRGCIPSKLLHSLDNLENLASKLKKNKMILEKAIEAELKEAEIEIIFAEADLSKLNDSEVLLNDGSKLEYSHLILAPGSRPKTITSFPNALTSDSFFSEENISKGLADKYLFIGGGYIGIELASMLARHKKQVRIIEAQDQILSFLDQDIHEKLMQALKTQKIKIETGVKDLSQIKVEADEEVFLSIGREATRVDYCNDNVHIIGDASNEIALAHYAYAQAKQLAAKLAGKNYEIDKNKVPLVIFTHPELASIGLSEKEARSEYGDAIETKIINWASNAKAKIMNYDRGMTKWIIHKNKILGCHIIGESATDLISIAVPIVSLNLSIDEMSRWIYPHPTLGEIFAW